MSTTYIVKMYVDFDKSEYVKLLLKPTNKTA